MNSTDNPSRIIYSLTKRDLFKYLLILDLLCSFVNAYSETFKLNMTFIVKNEYSSDKTSLTDYYINYKTKEMKGDEQAPIKKEKGFRLDLELNQEYTFIINKPGYISKTIFINTTVPDKREMVKFDSILCIMALDKAPVDFIIAWSRPFLKISYHTDKNEFAYDTDYTLTSWDLDLIKKRDKLFNKGLAMLHEGKYKDALEIFTAMLKKNPQDIAALYSHGRAAYKLNNKATACADWQSIRNFNKDFADNLIKDFCSAN